MSIPRPLLLVAILVSAFFVWTSTSAGARPFSKITDSERALTAVPGHPDAPAVVLFKRADLRLAESWSETPSTLEVEFRIKILKESGKSFGQIVIAHGAGVRMEHFEARTVLADGTVMPLGADALFREAQSRIRERFLTKAALPAVEVGAIVDYRYRLRLSSFLLEPWTFDEPLPTLISELTYHQPHGMEVDHHLRGEARLSTQSDAVASGKIVRIWGENLPPAREEPYGLPYEDLVSQAVIVPRREKGPNGSTVSPPLRSPQGDTIPVLDSWAAVCRGYEERVYRPLTKKARQVKRKASELTRGAGSAEARITALYTFVRDEIRLTANGIAASQPLDAVLAAGEGTYAEKALLLRALLADAGVPASLVWAIDWREGHVDPEIVNPGWFEKVLILAEPGGRRLFLDPGEKLAAGRLSPTNEGTRALVFDAEAPRLVDLPISPATEHQRRSAVELTVDDEGRLTGHGRLEISGHHAWYYLRLGLAPAVHRETWQKWLEGRLVGFVVGDVRVAEAMEEQRLVVEWTVSQHEEDVLGDEVSFLPSRPIGPLRQRYAIAPDQRRTPVHVSFADRDEVELVLSWPEGWEIDLLPTAVEHAGADVEAQATLEVDEDARRLVYRRTIEIRKVRFDPGTPYTELRELYTVMERHDAENLVLVRD